MDLREIRFKNRISQWELSKRSGVHQSRISLIENGHLASDEEKARVSKTLEIEVDEIDWPERKNVSGRTNHGTSS